MMDADMVGNPSLRNGDNGAAYNRHNHDSGPVTSERPEFRHPQGKNAGEHNRVEEADQEDAPHGHVAVTEHRDRHQRTR